MSRLVTFRVAGSGYALPAGAVREVVDLEEVTPLPFKGHRDVLGLARVRGSFVPVVGLPSDPGAAAGPGGVERSLLVLGQGSRRVGLRVDELGEVVEAEIARSSERGREVQLARVNDEVVKCLDPAALVGGNEELLKDRGGDMSESRDATEPIRLVDVRLGSEDFGIDVMKVLEVVKVPEMRRVPQAPAFVKGVTDVRGSMVPIIDLRDRFSLPDSELGPDHRVLIVDLEESRVGLIVDEVPGVLEYPPDSVSPPPKLFKGLKARYLDGLVRDGERLIMLLNVEEILSSEERIALKSLVEEDDKEGSGESKGSKKGGRRSKGGKKSKKSGKKSGGKDGDGK
jgi:purine-binding chemotaxis protein CheW